MSIFTKLWNIIKDILPFLKDAAQKAFEQLPSDAQDKLKEISKVVELVKQLVTAGKEFTSSDLVSLSGLTESTVESYLVTYATSKGADVTTLGQAIAFIKTEASNSTETGLKSLWTSLYNVISEEFSHIDWRTLLMGVGQFVYDEFVKGKINI